LRRALQFIPVLLLAGGAAALFTYSLRALPKKAEAIPVAPAQTDAPADLVLTNGVIYTGEAERPRAQAVALRGEWIVAVGANADVQLLIGPKTRVIDLHGRFAMPGFNDAHTHLVSAGLAKLSVDFLGARSLAEFQRRIRDRLKDYTPGEWMTGRGWDHTLWPVKRFPTRQDLDAVAADRPMIFGRVDGHVAVANSLALKIAGIRRDTPDPPGAHIVRDTKTGEPTGMLEEDAAMSLVWRKVPPPSPAQLRRGIKLVLAELARDGVTSAQDNSVQETSAWPVFLLYQELKKEDKLTARITEWLPFSAPLADLEEMRRKGGTTDPWLKTGAVKAFMDGSLGSRTAALLAPYSDDPSTSGILRMDPEQVKTMAVERDKAGFQLAFHAIGDRANRVALDAFAAARAENGPRDRRDRIEHAQVVAPSDFARFASLAVIASMQPSHETTDMRWAEARLGPERAKGAYAWKMMLKHGVRLAFGTDYPVETVNPMRGMYACVTRELPDGTPKGGWEPQEKLTMDDCIRAYTAGSAYAEFEENRKGVLAPKKLADIVVLSNDLTRIPASEILRTEAVLTIVGGRVVYEKK
jgi:predicted amidohydrolase YtcJ